MQTKKCNTCHQEKPLEAFYRKASSKDGHRNICKTCEESSRPKKGPQTKEQRVQSQLAVSEKKRESMKKFIEENPEFKNVLKNRKKAIIAIDTDTGTNILEFESAAASEKAGFRRNAVSAAISKKKPYRGFMWRFKNEE